MSKAKVGSLYSADLPAAFEVRRDMPAILAFWRMRQVDCQEFKANLDHGVSCSPASTIESDSVSKDKRIHFPIQVQYGGAHGPHRPSVRRAEPTAGNIKIEHEVMRVSVSLLYAMYSSTDSGWAARCSETLQTLQKLRTFQR